MNGDKMRSIGHLTCMRKVISHVRVSEFPCHTHKYGVQVVLVSLYLLVKKFCLTYCISKSWKNASSHMYVSRGKVLSLVVFKSKGKKWFSSSSRSLFFA